MIPLMLASYIGGPEFDHRSDNAGFVVYSPANSHSTTLYVYSIITVLWIIYSLDTVRAVK
jgi:hypothetical protein